MPDGRETPNKPVAYCRGCGNDFSGDSSFDKHRVGTHAYRWSLERPDGRRCMNVLELDAAFELDRHGRWMPQKSDKERERLALLAQR